MEEQPTPTPPPAAPYPDEAAEAELEFKPAVKIAAAALLLLAWVGVCFVFYRLGRKTGYEEGLASEHLAQQVNQEAVRNIAYFLQVAAADDKTLLDTVLHHEQRLDWVKDPTIKREALGMLLGVIMDRGLIGQAESALSELLPPTPEPAQPARATRLEKAARCLAQAGNWQQAKAYFLSAEDTYRALGESESMQQTLREHAALLRAGCGGAADARAAELQELLTRQQQHAADAAGLHAELHALLGCILLESGSKEAADSHFHQAVERPLPIEALPTSTLACYGAAFLELNDRENAAKYLNAAVERRSPGAAQSLYLAIAQRELATLALQATQAREALALLDSAQALATPAIPAGCIFWVSLAEQRGWAFFLARDYDRALAEFRQALQAVAEQDARLRGHLLEGMTRASLATGLIEAALPAAEECARLHQQQLPEDKEGLARAYTLLGRALDLAGQAARAAEAYGSAAATLPAESSDLLSALVSRAYALVQAQQWEDAASAWETILERTPAEDTALRERATAQLAACRKKTARAPEPAPRPRRSPSRRSR